MQFAVYQTSFSKLSAGRRLARFAVLSCALAAPALAQSQRTIAEPPRDSRSAAARAAVPGAPLTDLQKAERLLRRGEGREALAATDKILAETPLDVPARFLRGIILTELRRTDEALALFTELTVQNPHLPEPFNNLAVLYAERGQLERARDALEHAVAANPASPAVQENLGDIYVRLATGAYRRAALLEPGRRALRAKLQSIQALDGAPGSTPLPDPPSNGESK